MKEVLFPGGARKKADENSHGPEQTVKNLQEREGVSWGRARPTPRESLGTQRGDWGGQTPRVEHAKKIRGLEVNRSRVDMTIGSPKGKRGTGEGTKSEKCVERIWPFRNVHEDSQRRNNDGV